MEQFYENGAWMFSLAIFLTGSVSGMLVTWIIWGGRLRKMKKRIKKLDGEISFKKSENQRLMELASLHESDFAQLTREAEVHRNDLAGLRVKKAELETQLEVAREQISQLRATNQESTAKIEELKTRAETSLTEKSDFSENGNGMTVAMDRLEVLESRLNSLLNAEPAEEAEGKKQSD